MTLLELAPPAPAITVGWVAGYSRPVPSRLDDRFATGDDAVLREAFDEHGSLVFGICRRTVGADAEDVAQQVFVAAWKSRARFNAEKGSLAAWLTGIAKFKCVDHLRAKGRRPQTSGDDPADTGESSPEVARVADRLLLDSALAQLPEERRKVVAMAFFDDLTHQEISDRLAMPLGTVKSHVRRGLEALRRELDAAGMERVA